MLFHWRDVFATGLMLQVLVVAAEYEVKSVIFV